MRGRDVLTGSRAGREDSPPIFSNLPVYMSSIPTSRATANSSDSRKQRIFEENDDYKSKDDPGYQVAELLQAPLEFCFLRPLNQGIGDTAKFSCHPGTGDDHGGRAAHHRCLQEDIISCFGERSSCDRESPGASEGAGVNWRCVARNRLNMAVIRAGTNLEKKVYGAKGGRRDHRNEHAAGLNMAHG